MKKGIVLGITKSRAFIMEKGGNFKRVRSGKGWTVGDVVPTSHNVGYWAVHAAGILLMLLAIQFGVYHYISQPVSYISVDVNPSVQIAVNRLGNVIEATACNQDGEAILEHLDLKGKSYGDAVQALMEAEDMQPYLEDDPYVVVAVSSDAHQENEIAYNVNTVIRNLDGANDRFKYLCSVVDWDLVEKAHELGTTVGRLSMFEQLEGEDTDLTLEEFLDSPMSAVMKLLESGTKKGEDASKP